MAKKKADLGGKRLIGLAPTAWVRWVTQNSSIQAQEIVSSEFQWLGRESDVLVRAFSPEQGEFMVLNELQLRYQKNLPQRVRAYAALAEERYGLSVYPVLIDILPPPPKMVIAKRYESEFMGLKARQDYRIINLWEVDANLVFQQNLSPLLPFVPILKQGDEVPTVQRALQQLRADEQLSELENLLAFFASFVLSIPVVQQIMRWDMTVLHESPWYQAILKEGRGQALEEGLEQGLEQGARRLLGRMLLRRFDEVPAEVARRLEGLSVEQIEDLVDVALAVDSLVAFCDRIPPKPSRQFPETP